MKELALYFLDIVKNSTAAGAKQVELTLTENERQTLTVVIADNGKGMSPELLATVVDPFTTSRTTRKVGMGIPLYRMAAEQTGGTMSIESALGVGTTVTAVFHLDHIDCPPMGDLPGAAAMMIQGSPDIDFVLTHSVPGGEYTLDTRQLRQILGPDVPLSAPEVFLWVQDYLAEQEKNLNAVSSGRQEKE
ncbi:MAG: ATP-binding protein [Clostridiales bacterium]|nr:ATP-binding protein [Clostridiales bacterium]